MSDDEIMFADEPIFSDEPVEEIKPIAEETDEKKTICFVMNDDKQSKDSTPVAAVPAAPSKPELAPTATVKKPAFDPKPKAKTASFDPKPKAKPVEKTPAVAPESQQKPTVTETTAKVLEEPPVEKEDIVVSAPSAETIAINEAAMDEKREKMKKNLNIVFIGHVDAGKSTISGHIMFEIGGLDPRLLEKYEAEAHNLGRDSWKYAFAMDTTDEEREKGKTVECGRASFDTESRHVTILDAPGHKGFVHHMITGAVQGDAAVLVISARKGEFETGYENGGQTREHALIAYVCGIKNVIVAVNKMDDITVEWNFARFEYIRIEMTKFLTETGFNPKNIIFVPLSGFTGSNLVKRESARGDAADPKASWYTGPSLIEIVDSIKLPKRDTKSASIVPISIKFKESGQFAMAKIEQGKISVGDKMNVLPGKGISSITDIRCEVDDETTYAVNTAKAGDNVRIKLSNDDSVNGLQVGSVLVAAGLESSVKVSNTFVAKLFIIEHPTVVTNHFGCVLHLSTIRVNCKIEKILATLDKKTGKVDTKLPPYVKPGQHCLAKIVTDELICVSTFEEFERLGRFMLRYETFTVAIGLVHKVKAPGEN